MALLDHALNIYFKRNEESHSYGYNPKEIANHIENSRRMMKYWIERDDEERTLSIKYEDLVSNPSSVLRSALPPCPPKRAGWCPISSPSWTVLLPSVWSSPTESVHRYY